MIDPNWSMSNPIGYKKYWLLKVAIELLKTKMNFVHFQTEIFKNLSSNHTQNKKYV